MSHYNFHFNLTQVEPLKIAVKQSA